MIGYSPLLPLYPRSVASFQHAPAATLIPADALNQGFCLKFRNCPFNGISA